MTEQEKLAEKRAKASAYMRAYYATEKHQEYRRRYYAANRDRLNKTANARNAANPDKVAARNRKKNYGIDQDQFDAMLTAQRAACAICSTTEPKGRGAFHVDHCHSTGTVRGLLCHNCNVGLGHFRDDTALLMRATEYIHAARTQCPSSA